jgi:hypothetical protein
MRRAAHPHDLPERSPHHILPTLPQRRNAVANGVVKAHLPMISMGAPKPGKVQGEEN